MSRQKPRLVALLIARATMLAYPELLPEIAYRLGQRGLETILSVLQHESDAAGAIRALEQLDLTGVVAAVPLYPVDSVSCDHAACGRLLANLLLAGGHRRFGLIASPADSPVGTERIRGALETLRYGHARSIEVETGDYSYASGARAVDAFFKRMKPKPSAIIGANDAMAIGALDRARELQSRVPRDLSVVGIDGIVTATLPSYQLTTVRQPLERMAAAAVELLLARITDPQRSCESRLLSGDLIRGRTARFERRRSSSAR
jgi:DNA-binding LacI/PurR family transcriptional regulator